MLAPTTPTAGFAVRVQLIFKKKKKDVPRSKGSSMDSCAARWLASRA
jgi:hypothetical protein